MAFRVTMPRLGWSMEVGTLAGWLKRDGDPVQAGEALFTVEGDKALQEVEALESGILRIPPDAPMPGQQLPVGALLAYIVQPGEAAPFETELSGERVSESSDQQFARAQEAMSKSVAAAPVECRQLPSISPRARRVAAELGVEWRGLKGSGRSGRILERDVRQAAEHQAAVRVSPLARRLAGELGVDIAELATQQPGKRIQRADVEAAAQQATSEAARTVAGVPGTVLAITGTRRLIAQRMAESAHRAAAVTLTTDADASQLVALRDQLKATLAPRGRLVPGYTEMLVRLTGLALQEHRLLNAFWVNDEIVIPDSIHIGVAVDTDAGLLVPVVRDVPQKSLEQITQELAALIEGARARQLAPEVMQGGTFTLTNLGMYGVDAFTPIINAPQTAILGVGRIFSRPWVRNGQVVACPVVALSLTFDHRVVDGGPAARFLNTIREFVEQPYLWLTR